MPSPAATPRKRGLTKPKLHCALRKNKLATRELHANFDGVVTAWSAEVGQFVGDGQAVVTIARPDTREAAVDIPDELIDHVAPGMVFNVRLEACDEDYREGTRARDRSARRPGHSFASRSLDPRRPRPRVSAGHDDHRHSRARHPAEDCCARDRSARWQRRAIRLGACRGRSQRRTANDRRREHSKRHGHRRLGTLGPATRSWSWACTASTPAQAVAGEAAGRSGRGAQL